MELSAEDLAEYAAEHNLSMGDIVIYQGSLGPHWGEVYYVGAIGEGVYGQPGALTLVHEQDGSVRPGDPNVALWNVRPGSVIKL